MMFKKVLIAEDHEIANISVQKTLTDLGIDDTKYVYYCDDALTYIKKAIANNTPYDLLITDLSFEDDGYQQKIAGGMELIKVAKHEQPDLKVIVLSAENKPAIIDSLFKELLVDGYVRKARNDGKNLKAAITTVSNGKKHFSRDLKQIVKEQNSHEFTDFDIKIISLLSQGMLQKDIPVYLQQHNIKPSGLSSIEKRLNLIKDVLDFSKNEQLIAFCKDIGII